MKALIRSVMTYACPAWEFAAESDLLKLQRLQIRVLRTIGNLSRRTSVRQLHVTFQIPWRGWKNFGIQCGVRGQYSAYLWTICPDVPVGCAVVAPLT
jgi:hypothetical protein